MFNTVFGLPVHALVVHAATVLLPLAAVLTAVLAWLPARWRAFGLPVAALDLVLLGVAIVAKESGEKLEHRLPRTDLIHEHAEIGDKLPLVAGLLLLCVLVPAFFGWRSRRASLAATKDPVRHDWPAASLLAPRWAQLATGVASTLVALAVIYLTVKAGHSGAEAVWRDVHFIR